MGKRKEPKIHFHEKKERFCLLLCQPNKTQKKSPYQFRMSGFMDEALAPNVLVFVPNVWGIYTCGHDQFSQKRMLEKGFRFGSYYSYFWFNSFLMAIY